MKKKSTILLALLISIQSITSAGFTGRNCSKSNKETATVKEQCRSLYNTVSNEERDMDLDPLHFFLFVF